jgi:hypothetical protein
MLNAVADPEAFSVEAAEARCGPVRADADRESAGNAN